MMTQSNPKAKVSKAGLRCEKSGDQTKQFREDQERFERSDVGNLCVAPVPSHCDKKRDLNTESVVASIAMDPNLNAAAVVRSYSQSLGDPTLVALCEALSMDVEVLWEGDMKRAEAMLYGQAHALQAIFMNLARRAADQQYLKQWDAYLHMALKAQNQCRMTLETLATVKNPPLVIARQANINNGGHQQVNNVTYADSSEPNPPRAKKASVPTELLDPQHGKRMDKGTTGASSGDDSSLEAVGAVHGTFDR